MLATPSGFDDYGGFIQAGNRLTVMWLGDVDAFCESKKLFEDLSG